MDVAVGHKNLALSLFSFSCSPKFGTVHKKWRGVRFRMGVAYSYANNCFIIQIIN